MNIEKEFITLFALPILLIIGLFLTYLFKLAFDLIEDILKHENKKIKINCKRTPNNSYIIVK